MTFIRFIGFFYLLLSACLQGVEESSDGNRRPGEAGELKKPYQGYLSPDAGSVRPDERRETPITLNYFIPPGKALGKKENLVPLLARLEGDEGYSDAHAFREKLPDAEEIKALETYEDYLRVLGLPIDAPSGFKTRGGWSYDLVTWRLFSPAEGNDVDVLHITLRRKWRTDWSASEQNRSFPDYQVDRVSMRSGLFEPRPPGALRMNRPFLLPGLSQQGPSVLPLDSPVVSSN